MHPPAPPKSKIRLELLIPAATAVITLILGAGLNAIASNRLERQKFQFEVLKYTLNATKDPVEQLRMLCRFSQIGFISDPSKAYHRAEVDGVRACASSGADRAFVPRRAYDRLAQEIGRANNSAGSIAFEQGFLKIDGALGEIRAPETKLITPGLPTRIEIVAVFAPRKKWDDATIKSVARAATSTVLVRRDGAYIQVANLYSAPGGVVRVGIVNAGPLTFGLEGRGGGLKLYDSGGTTIERSEGFAFKHVGGSTIGRQRFPKVQIEAAQRLVDAVCALAPHAQVAADRYLLETLGLQQDKDLLRPC
ncbi:hypothetical protein BXU08_00710 [Sphingomonas sp. LM7]|nr:hypothetical protein BXU08_00710 [Sphingomonas sp. LM7]